jgi:hypothetical protein
MENSIYKYVSGAERLIFMSLPDKPTFNFIKIIDKTFIDIFSKFINIEMSRFVTKETYNQIVGGFVVFKVSPETMEKISRSEDILDASFVVTSMGIYAILKKFLYTNDSQLLNTLSEVSAYIDVEIKTQFGKYGIKDDDFIINREMCLFLAFSGLQSFTVEEETSKAIKTSHFSLFKKKQPPEKTILKEQIIPEQQQPIKQQPIKNKKNEKQNKKDKLEENQNEYDNVEKEEKELKGEGELKYIVKEWLKLHFLPKEVVTNAEKDKEEKTKEKYENKKKAIDLENKKLELEIKKENYDSSKKGANKNTKSKQADSKNTEDSESTEDNEDSNDVGL